MIRRVADCRPGIRLDGHVNHDLAQKFSLAIEYLNTTIATVSNIDISLRIHGDAVRSIDLTGLVTGFAPRLEPVPFLVDFGDSGIDVTVADLTVARGIPRHIRYLSEQSIFRRQWWLHFL